MTLRLPARRLTTCLVSRLSGAPTSLLYGPVIRRQLALRPPVRRYSAAAASFAEKSRPSEYQDNDEARQNDEAPPLLPLEVLASAPPAATSGITLRPYQQSAIQACLTALDTGLTRLGVSSPTGSGKTTMFMNLIPLVPPPRFDPEPWEEADEKGRTLIVVSSVELASQAENAAKRILGNDWTVEVEQSKRYASGKANVTIATYQTLLNTERFKKFDPTRFKMIIVDEAHHAAAHSYLRLLHYFNDGVKLPSTVAPISKARHGVKVPIIGFSATFSRPDQLALSAVFEKIVFHQDISSMLQEGWLSPAKSTSVHADLHLDQVELNPLGDYKTASLASRVNTPEVNKLVVGTYLQRCADRRSTLVFCVDLDHVASLVQSFRDAGVDARSVSSLSHPKARKETVDGFGRGDFPVLVNCEVLTEGTDIPEIDCILLARPTKSRNLLAQMVGRGLRLSPSTGKTDCHIIDIVDNMSSGMLVSPTLWGLSHDDIQPYNRPEGQASDAQADRPSTQAAVQGKMDKVTFIDQDDPFRIASPTRPVLAMMSKNAWVACGRDRYVLEMLGNGFITVNWHRSEDPPWSVTFRQRLPKIFGSKAPFARPRIIAHAEELERALQTADAFAERRLGRDLASKISRYASWRTRPASRKQLEMLLKMKGVSVEETSEIRVMGRTMKVSELNAGQVAAVLCAAQHGGVTSKKKADQSAASAEKKHERKTRKARELAERNLPLPTV